MVERVVLIEAVQHHDDLFFRKLLKVMPTVRDKKVAGEVVEEAESVVMRYLWVTLLINLCQGTIVALVLLRHVSWIVLPWLGFTLVGAHLVLLFWEMRYVSMSLAAPGLRPRLPIPTGEK